MNDSGESRLREQFHRLLLGTAVGDALGLPDEGLSPNNSDWLVKGILEWPRSVDFIAEVSKRVFETYEKQITDREVTLFWPGAILRNIFLLLIVLFHGFRRLFPPS